MKILLYNWVHFDDPLRQGGGVSVYLRATIEALLTLGHEVWFLCAGTDYDLLSRRPRVVATMNSFGSRVRSYSLFNSEVTAPSHFSFGSDKTFDAQRTHDAFRSFLEKSGPFDIVHFNNLEGLPATVLKLRNGFPQSRFVFSLHNYFIVCPQVNLWRNENENCHDFNAGSACVSCVPQLPPSELRIGYSLNSLVAKLRLRMGSGPHRMLLSTARRARPLFKRVLITRRRFVSRRNVWAPALASQTTQALSFVQRRAKMTTLVDANCDLVLAVSERTAAVHRKFGLEGRGLRVSYIGSAGVDQSRPRKKSTNERGYLHLCYLGYMRRDKGFYFLLDALEALPPEVAKGIRLTVAAKTVDRQSYDRLMRLTESFPVRYYDGYRPEHLDEILAPVDLGVVPVLWEDNLPQVAIEMAGRGVPVLTSDLGGAQEIGANAAFVFAAGDRQAFAKRLEDLLTGTVSLGDFWLHSRKLRSPLAATEELVGLYRSAFSAQVGAASRSRR